MRFVSIIFAKNGQKIDRPPPVTLMVTDHRVLNASTNSIMIKAETGMNLALRRLRDYVRCLKHNLIAQAICALKKEVSDTEIEVPRLIQDIMRSIAEADNFFKTLD